MISVEKMMKSINLAGKLNQIVPRVPRSRNLGAISGGGKAADPDTHAVDPEEVNDASEAAKAAPPPHSGSGKDDHYIPPKKPAFPPSGSSPRVKSTEMNPPVNPRGQQGRPHRDFTTAIDADCIGFDGSPLPEAAAAEEDRAADGRRQREEQEKDNKEYFKHHRASPLSELKIADTRKPITQASSGSVGGGYFGTPEMQVWRPEQIVSAEEEMRRAREIWMNNAIRGDPDSPHGRILRKLRGEDW